MKVPYSYLNEQFSNPDPILEDIKELVKSGDFTLGKALTEFEESFAKFLGTHYAVGVGTGTDAIRLSLIAAGIKAGDEVITAANTFYSTAGAIATIGAIPVFVDVDKDALIDVHQIEKYITPKTKAIVPVHLHGTPVDMNVLMEIAKKHNLLVVEDTCQSMGASIDGKMAGTFGTSGCFSLHPLKPLNVWGDAGVIITNDKSIRDRLLLLRNNGLKNRDECKEFAYNCRMDTLQAVIGNHLIGDLASVLEKKRENSTYYDEAFTSIKEIVIPKRTAKAKCVFHNYILFVERRDELVTYLNENNISAKVHYPIPLHMQEASEYLGYKEGDFPEAEKQAKCIISLPVHQHLSREQIDYVIKNVKRFYHD